MSSENDPQPSNVPLSNNTQIKSKTILTQEFNTLPSTITSMMSANSCATFPFLISPDFSLNTEQSSLSTFPTPPIPTFYYQPIPFPYTPIAPNSKRIKLAESETSSSSSSSSDLVEQLNSFKMTLKSSFDKNIQKLEVLDRLVRTVTVKGNVQVDSIKIALEFMGNCRQMLKELLKEQVDLTTGLSVELQNFLKTELIGIISKVDLIPAANVVPAVDLIDKLRREEDSHLTDLTILSTRNRELQKDQKCLKDQLERLQLEYADSLKSFAHEREEFKAFTRNVTNVLQIDNSDDENSCFTNILESLDVILKEKTNLQTELISLFKTLSDLKQFAQNNAIVDYGGLKGDFIDCFNFLIQKFKENFEEILFSRETFYNSTLTALTRKIEQLFQFQGHLSRQGLNMKRELEASLAAFKTLESQFSLLTEKHNSLKIKESEMNHYKTIFQERISALEKDLSIKNQENRQLSIKIQEIHSEMEENAIKHRHDISALERKIMVLEGKLAERNAGSGSKSIKDLMMIDLDPFSSSGPTKCNQIDQEHVEDHEINDQDVVPPTFIKKNLLITFTGIRDSRKQKEITEWIENLGASVHFGAEFNEDITHVLAPRGHKSIRVLAASLTGKWIVPIEWIEASHKAGHFVPETFHHGFHNSNIRPFRLRTIWMSAAFTATHKSHPAYPTAALRVLLEKLGRARWTENSNLADFLLVTEEEKDNKLIGSSRGHLITLNNLIDMIPIE